MTALEVHHPRYFLILQLLPSQLLLLHSKVIKSASIKVIAEGANAEMNISSDQQTDLGGSVLQRGRTPCKVSANQQCYSPAALGHLKWLLLLPKGWT